MGSTTNTPNQATYCIVDLLHGEMQKPSSTHTDTHLEQKLLAFVLAQANLQLAARELHRAEEDFKSTVADAQGERWADVRWEVAKALSAYNALVANAERGGGVEPNVDSEEEESSLHIDRVFRSVLGDLTLVHVGGKGFFFFFFPFPFPGWCRKWSMYAFAGIACF